MSVQNQSHHPNHDLSQKPIVQHQNQIKQQWNHTGQVTGAQVDEKNLENKSIDWAPNNQIQHQGTTNYHSSQEMFSQVSQQVQSSQVPMGYVPGQQIPHQSTQVAQVNLGKIASQPQTGMYNKTINKFRIFLLY